MAAVVAAILLARWTWILFAPQAPEVLVEPTISHEKTGRLFGEVASGVAAQTLAAANLELVGVFSGTRGFAVFELDGKKQLGVPLGGELQPGVRLVEVNSDHVVIEKGSVRQKLMLEQNQKAISSAAAAVVQSPPVPAGAIQESIVKP